MISEATLTSTEFATNPSLFVPSSPASLLCLFVLFNILALISRGLTNALSIRTAYLCSFKFSTKNLRLLNSNSRTTLFPTVGEYLASTITYPERSAFEFLLPLFIGASGFITVIILSSFLIFWLGYSYIYVIIALLFIYVFLYNPILIRTSKEGGESARIKSELNNMCSDIYNNINLIDSFKASSFVNRQVFSSLRRLNALHTRITIYSTLPKFIIEGISLAIIVLASSYSAYRTNGSLSINIVLASVISFAFAAQRILPYINQIFSSLSSMKSAEYMFTSMLDKFELSHQPIDFSISSSNRFTDSDIAIKVLGYNVNSKFLPFSASFKIGSHSCIKGASGCGKSTLFLSMLRLTSVPLSFNCSYNSSLLDDNYMLDAGFVPQSSSLFGGTVRDNLLFGPSNVSKYNYSSEHLYYYLEICDLYHVIQSLPDGLDTFLTPASHLLSGGQIQRLSICRAILHSPSVLFLDESTSSLDVATESRIIKNILKLDLTIVSIAHRQSFLEFSDESFEFFPI